MAPLFKGWNPKELQGLSSSLNSDEMEKWLLSKMSQRGWVQIINNLAASSLWHQLAVFLNQHTPAKSSESASQNSHS